MSFDIDIRVRDLSKVYRIYEKPEDRLVQMATLGRVRRFTEFPALTGISFDIRRGETVGIVGRNGCGKSTLLQIICGTLQPSAGTVEVTGRISALLELGAGFNSEFSGRENVYMNGAILGFSRAEMDERFAAIADFAGIGDFIERPVKTYSSGMFVRLAFAVATAVEPDILVVDEALSVGDEAFQRKCFARIEAIKARGGTILFVSHNAQTVVQLCDRAILLDGGEKLMEGTPKQVTSQYLRLLHAPPDRVADMRSSIQAIEEPEPDPVDFEASLEPVTLLECFDPSLKPSSTVENERRGAIISNVHITNDAGNPVNVLRRWKRYRIVYETLFEIEVEQIGFATHVKTTNGTGLAGGSTMLRRSRPLKRVQSGERVSVEFEFSCCAAQGVYFCNVGVVGIVGDDQFFLHRIQDAIAFRVLPDADVIELGPADFDFTTSIRSLGVSSFGE